jgi:hypothetical protein
MPTTTPTAIVSSAFPYWVCAIKPLLCEGCSCHEHCSVQPVQPRPALVCTHHPLQAS